MKEDQNQSDSGSREPGEGISTESVEGISSLESEREPIKENAGNKKLISLKRRKLEKEDSRIKS